MRENKEISPKCSGVGQFCLAFMKDGANACEGCICNKNISKIYFNKPTKSDMNSFLERAEKLIPKTSREELAKIDKIINDEYIKRMINGLNYCKATMNRTMKNRFRNLEKKGKTE